ncbi:MAG: hypothetical protein J5I98_24745 [Phaeodactylibacter sp.]|nr:hypothetical protein [Phaeodactylibacter sp.]
METCETLIAKGRTGEAFARLTALEEKPIRKRFISLSNQFNALDRQFKSGIITLEEFNAKAARIKAGRHDSFADRVWHYRTPDWFQEA